MMKPSRSPLPALAACFALAFPSVSSTAETEPPASPLILEAENHLPNQDALVRVEAGTSGGSYVSHGKPWNPLFLHKEIPSGTPCTVWARVRGTNLCLKAIGPEGGQNELRWAFKVPEEWTWIHMGTYPAEKLGAGLILIRGEGATEDAGLDVVVLDPGTGFDPQGVPIEELGAGR